MKFGKQGFNSNSFIGPDELNNDIDNYMGKDGRSKNIRTSKNKYGRRINSNFNNGEEIEYYYDPKTGRKMRVCDSMWSPTRKDRKKDFQFAENHIPHGDNCGPNCFHLIRANLIKKRINRKLLPMNTNNMEKFSDIYKL